jgi:tRNA-Thr(GGU) m(6)t(6)A37 methyltransferase TsaA
MEFIMKPIGIIHSPFTEKREMPIQASRSQSTGSVEVYPEFMDGLKDLDGFSHIIIFYIFHQSTGFSLHVKPFLDDHERGLFATRYPARPNPIGISIVELENVQANYLTVKGIDVLDGTPLLDIKPYVPDFDVRLEVRTGWYETRSKK